MQIKLEKKSKNKLLQQNEVLFGDYTRGEKKHDS